MAADRFAASIVFFRELCLPPPLLMMTHDAAGGDTGRDDVHPVSPEEPIGSLALFAAGPHSQ